MKKLKRTLYLLHRWFGVALCVVFALWFASGIVMMYVEYPELTEEERTHFLPTLKLQDIQFSIAELQDKIPSNKKITALTLTTVAQRPAFQIELDHNDTAVLFADNGDYFTSLTTDQVLQTAVLFDLHANPEYRGEIEMDQWTISSVLNNHRPLHKVALNNESGTVLYVSSLTGQVVRDTHAWERTWNWVGSTIHWIYPMVLRRHSNLWVEVVIYISLLGLVSVVTGTIVGFLRIRLKKRYKNGSLTPYRGVQKWHHISGLICLSFVATFLVSGLFSMNPWGIFDNKTSPAEQIGRYHGQNFTLEGLWKSIDTLRQQSNSIDIKELHWTHLGGDGVLIANTTAGRRILNLSKTETQEKIKQAISQLIPGSLSHIETLTQFDNYYYSTHNRFRPLPVYRSVFNDPEKTWFYVNAKSGELLGRTTQVDRVERWLYNGLHSLDFQFLLAYRPLWDIVVLVLSLAGLVFCCTSIVIGWRRVKIKVTGKRVVT